MPPRRSGASTRKPRSTLPGVVAVFTGADVEDRRRRVRAARRCPDCACRTIDLLAQDRVYFVGHPVAVVVATDRYIAPTPRTWSRSITSPARPSPIPRKRSRRARPPVHPEWPDNVAFTFHQEGGDVEKAFARSGGGRQAAHHQPAPDSDRDGDARRGGRVARGRKALTMYSSTQIPHLMRTMVARMLGMPENQLRVVTPEVGGGFGSKLNVYAEEA